MERGPEKPAGLRITRAAERSVHNQDRNRIEHIDHRPRLIVNGQRIMNIQLHPDAMGTRG